MSLLFMNASPFYALHSLSPMAAYATLLAVARSLHQILNLEQYSSPLHKENSVSLHEKVNSIVNFLEDYSEKHRGALDHLGKEIRNAAHEAEDFMDSYLYSISRTHDDLSSSEVSRYEVSLDQDLNMVLERINFIWEEVMEMKNRDKAEDLPSRTHSSPVDHSSTVKISAKNNIVVGFDDDLSTIKERLYEDSDELLIIPIVGMGGIGKTTLARKAYEDSRIAQHFDIRAWITVSGEYQRREILSELLQSFEKPDKEQSDASDAQLAKQVYQTLIGRRYLIVIDDLWSTKDWDDLKMIFPDDGSGSRILLTTRLLDVAVLAGSSSTLLHQMKFLNEDQSWNLLQETIFGDKSCPLQLVEIGKNIARSCGGLPLTIVVVAGLLLSTKKELWENVSENISSTESTIALQCSKILYLSYERLPLRLKPCFLYMTAFPEDSVIDVSKLMKLWAAEGFLKPGDQCLEDVGEGYLEDLLNRSLILVREKCPDGKHKTVGIHDLLREICIEKAEDEGFLHHISLKGIAEEVTIENPHRLSLHFPTKREYQNWQIQDSSVRSVLIFSQRYLVSSISLSCRKLNILDARTVTWLGFSEAISTFFNLRYIAFELNALSCPDGFPVSISKLPNLQTIIVYTNNMRHWEVPYEIWEMPKLRHLIMDLPLHLSYPSNVGVIHESDLQTLETVINFRFTEMIIKIFRNLKKLKVRLVYGHHWNDVELKNLFRLQNLQELRVSMSHLDNHPSMVWNHAFPMSPKKLILNEVPFPWKNMTIIGSLPNLQVLEMMNMKKTGFFEWMPVEGQFLGLKYFRSSLDYLFKWEVEKEHFPSLESLVLWGGVWGIDEIPCGIGEIDSLQLIELKNCQKSLVNSAKRIQKQQQENGNDDFQVRVTDSKGLKKGLKSFVNSIVNSAKRIQKQQQENGNDDFQVRVINSV